MFDFIIKKNNHKHCVVVATLSRFKPVKQRCRIFILDISACENMYQVNEQVRRSAIDCLGENKRSSRFIRYHWIPVKDGICGSIDGIRTYFRELEKKHRILVRQKRWKYVEVTATKETATKLTKRYIKYSASHPQPVKRKRTKIVTEAKPKTKKCKHTHGVVTWNIQKEDDEAIHD